MDDFSLLLLCYIGIVKMGGTRIHCDSLLLSDFRMQEYQYCVSMILMKVN